MPVLLQGDIDVFSQPQRVQCKALARQHAQNTRCTRGAGSRGPYGESRQRGNGPFWVDPKGAQPLAPDGVIVLAKVDDIPGDRCLAWNKQLNAEYVNITLKEYE